MGLFDFLRSKKVKNCSIEQAVSEKICVELTPSEVETSAPEADNISNKHTHMEKPRPKCNCDGCINQDSCKYGHVIYDEFDKTRLSLADKFVMLHTFDSFEPIGDFDDIATIEERHHQKKLMNLSKDKVLRTLNYLQEQKKLYLAVGKCGKAYYNFENMGAELQLVKETLKEYNKYL